MLPILLLTTPGFNLQASCSLLVCISCLPCCLLALLAPRRAYRNDRYSWIAGKEEKAKLYVWVMCWSVCFLLCLLCLLFVCLYNCLFVCLLVCVFVCKFVCLRWRHAVSSALGCNAKMKKSWTICLLYVCLFVCMSVCVCLSVSQCVCVTDWLIA